MRLVGENEVDEQERRRAFYSCQFKACGKWEGHITGEGERSVFTRREIEEMVRRGEI